MKWAYRVFMVPGRSCVAVEAVDVPPGGGHDALGDRSVHQQPPQLVDVRGAGESAIHADDSDGNHADPPGPCGEMAGDVVDGGVVPRDGGFDEDSEFGFQVGAQIEREGRVQAVVAERLVGLDRRGTGGEVSPRSG